MRIEISQSTRRVMCKVVFYLGLVAIVAGARILTSYIDNQPIAPTGITPDAASKAIDEYAAVASMLITLATGLLAGMAWLFSSKARRTFPTRDAWPAACGVALACLSVYFGFVSSQNAEVATELSLGISSPILQLPRQCQFYALLSSVLFFADFVRRDWREVEQHES